MKLQHQFACLAVGIALTLAAHFALDTSREGASDILHLRSLLPSAADAVGFSSLELHGSDASHLTLDCDGGDWRIVSPYAADADRNQVLRLFDVLSCTPVTDELSDADLLRLGRTRSDFGLDHPRVSLAVTRPGGSRTEVSFGAVTPVGDGVYAAVANHAAVLVVPTNVLSAVDCAIAGFRRRSLVAVDADSVTSIDLKGGSGKFCRLVREGDTWKISEPTLAAAASNAVVNRFLDDLIAAECASFVWPVGATNESAKASASLLAGYGLDPDGAVTVTLKCRDGRDRSVSFGNSAGSALVYAATQDGKAIVTVADSLRTTAAAGARAFADMRLFPFEVSEVSAISLEQNGVVNLLSRQEDRSWRLDAPVTAPANDEFVATLVERIVRLTLADLDEDGIRVTVGTASEPVVISAATLLGEHRMEDLRSREMLRIPSEHVRRLGIRVGEGPVRSVRYDVDRRVWALDNPEVSGTVAEDRVRDVLSALDPLNALRVVRLKVSAAEMGVFGLDKPSYRISIDQSDEGSLRRNVLLGDVTDGGRYATTGSSDAVFVISAETAAKLMSELITEK